jgi:hypothetical protein
MKRYRVSHFYISTLSPTDQTEEMLNCETRDLLGESYYFAVS